MESLLPLVVATFVENDECATPVTEPSFGPLRGIAVSGTSIVDIIFVLTFGAVFFQ